MSAYIIGALVFLRLLFMQQKILDSTPSPSTLQIIFTETDNKFIEYSIESTIREISIFLENVAEHVSK